MTELALRRTERPGEPMVDGGVACGPSGKMWIRRAALGLVLALACCGAPIPKYDEDVPTATGQSPEKNVRDYGIPAIIVPFGRAVPDGMLTDPAERAAMIEAKIAHLEEVNDLFWGDAPGTPEERQALYDEVWSAADQYFVAFQGLGTDWDGLHDTYRQRIGLVESYGEYLSIITKTGYLLREGHTHMVPRRLATAFLQRNLAEQIVSGPVPGLLPRVISSSIGGCIAVTSEEELVVNRLGEGAPNPYRLQIGDEIVGFNGVPWDAWLPRLEAADLPIMGSSDGAESARRYTLLRSAMQNAHLFEAINLLRTGSGVVDTLPIEFINGDIDDEWDAGCPEWTETPGLVALDDPRKSLSWKDDPILVHGIIEGENAGIIYIKHLDPPDPAKFSARFESAVLDLMETEGLIIDLRGNGGGEFASPLFQGLAHLVRGTEDRQFYEVAVNDPASANRTRLVDIREGWGEACDRAPSDDRFDLKGLCAEAMESAHHLRSHPFRADNPDLFYEYPILVLVGPGCGSACDHLAHLLSQFPEFTLVGRDPNGSLTFPKNWDRVYTYPQMQESVTLMIPAVAPYAIDGDEVLHLSRAEGLVDVEVWLTKEDIIKGLDTVRERALQLIRESRAVEQPPESGGTGGARPAG